ncbi:MAG: hypothetical protein M5U34_28000 [Chloroflexi bacterium]|nr:hypothetical protein [Chloroflexota bacterium]
MEKLAANRMWAKKAGQQTVVLAQNVVILWAKRVRRRACASDFVFVFVTLPDKLLACDARSDQCVFLEQPVCGQWAV